MDRSALSGNLEFISLSEVLQVLGNNYSTGQLVIVNKYIKEPGIIYISDGLIFDAVCQDQTGEEAVIALFGWLKGQFEFTVQPVKRDKVIIKGRMELIMEALKKLDEGKIQKVGPVSYEKLDAGSEDHGRQIPLIKGPLVDYLHVVDEESFNAGDSIINEGKYGRWAWVILEGTVEIVKKTASGDIPIIRLGPGSFLGTSAFLSGGILRTSTDIAMDYVQLGVLNQESLSRELTSVSREFRKINESYVSRFTNLVNTLAGLYAGEKSPIGFGNGKAMIWQGKPDKNLYEIDSGRGFLIREQNRQTISLMNLKAGDYVGNIPFLNDVLEPGSASVIVSDKTEFHKVDPDLVYQEYERLPQTLKNIFDNISVCISVVAQLICDFHQNKNK